MNKKEIIGIVNNAISKEIDNKVFSDDDKYGLGCNQFREFANICSHAECYEEIELQVMYNKAKAGENKSWNNKHNGKAIADVVLCCMDEIRKNSSSEECLKNLSLMFGYFYWNARICAAKNNENRFKSKDNNYHKNNYNSNNKNFNGGYNNQKRG